MVFLGSRRIASLYQKNVFKCVWLEIMLNKIWMTIQSDEWFVNSNAEDLRNVSGQMLGKYSGSYNSIINLIVHIMNTIISLAVECVVNHITKDKFRMIGHNIVNIVYINFILFSER